MFIMLTGSSGVGKNTLINELKLKNNKVVLMPTLTTRAMRAGEVEGNPFYYLTKESFEAKIAAGELFEHELIHGNFYGSSKLIFDEYLKNGIVLMKDIGVEGAINLSRILKHYTKTIKVFLTTKTKRELIKRLKERGEKDIKKRLKRFSYEQAQKHKFDFIILNKNKVQTTDILLNIIANENSIDNFVFTKPVNKLNLKKINKLAGLYRQGIKQDTVKVALKENKIVLLKGHEKLVASLIAGVDICKIVKENKNYKILTQKEQDEWKEYLGQVKN
jgi:guanylate kinase